MIASALFLAASCMSPDAKVAGVLERWCSAVKEVESLAPGPAAPLREKMLHLIRMDEVTRQNLWPMDGPALDTEQRRIVEDVIGRDLLRIDQQNTEALKRLLPASGWFSNSVHVRQVTHGAWLIAQHSPQDAFREYALGKMAVLVKSGDVMPRIMPWPSIASGCTRACRNSMAVRPHVRRAAR
ncbi:hypothetical protein [Sphingomonas sp. 22176]|uniref:hypothetical protein n=1 Tax=Sphingomonas sp. 22176 TaxID=3453884 RepID=UPI003F82AC66